MEENTISFLRACNSLIFLCLLVHMTGYCVHGMPTCPQRQSFFDELTNRRECCSDICQSNELVELCKTKCPGFHLTTSPAPPLDCPPGGSYLNVSTNQKACCAHLCSNKDIAEITSLCPQCPDILGYAAQIGEEHPVDVDQSGGIITPVVVGCVVVFIVTSLVFMVYVYRKRYCHRLHKNDFKASYNDKSDKQEKVSLSKEAEKQGVEKQTVTEVSWLNETSA